MRKKIVLRVGKTLYPGDEGFEDAAKKHGLWIPWGSERQGIFIETQNHISPDAKGFAKLLEKVMAGDAEAWVVVSEA